MYQGYVYIFLGTYYHITKLSCQYIFFSLAEQINSWVKKVKNITGVLGYSFINSDPFTFKKYTTMNT